MDWVVAACMAMDIVGEGSDTSYRDVNALLEVVEACRGISLFVLSSL